MLNDGAFKSSDLEKTLSDSVISTASQSSSYLYFLLPLRLPCHDPALDVDLPTARTRAIHAVRGAHNLVVRPSLTIGIFPLAILGGCYTVPVGKCSLILLEEGQAVQKLAHGCCNPLAGDWGVAANVEKPGDHRVRTFGAQLLYLAM